MFLPSYSKWNGTSYRDLNVRKEEEEEESDKHLPTS